MSGVSRFLSKREKTHKHHFSSPHHHHHEKSLSTDNISNSAKQQPAVDPESAADFYGLFVANKPASIAEDPKVKSIRQKIIQSKGVLVKDCHILWALRSRFGPGDPDTAFDLLVAMSDASERIITPYDPAMKMRGSNNRELVTCFLDSTLFAMFSRLDSFEAMLYNSFSDLPREKLAFLLRIWVNLLRRGKLITTDITEEIQNSLAECGWEDARELQQQDASEAFAFITEQLNLPLLTLKMDIYHTGKQDNDDHKLIKERLLEVGIPRLPDGNVPAEIKLEDCLEEFFNNKIEVKRYLERRNTLTSTKSYEAQAKGEKAIHVETVEIDPDMPSPLTPLSTLSTLPSHSSFDRPQTRHRAPSIIQERFIPDKEDQAVNPSTDPRSALGRIRGGSVRKEVVMPAWQFFSLIPWYTDHAPSTDAQVADHFSVKRPVLGLCLKRYDYTRSGEAIRLNTDVDVPVDIALPHFIQDGRTDADGPSFGNFKLSLQSAVCHRGDSVHSGHYIALVRSDAENVKDGEMSHWLRFDDLATPKVSLINIHKALKEEKPYLLFYQILPIDGDPGNLTVGEQPPSYPATPALDNGTDGVQGDPLIAVQSISSTSLSGRASFEHSSSDEARGRSPENQVRRHSAVSFSEHLPVPRKSLEHYREQAFSDYRAPEHRKNGSTSSSGGLGRRLSKLTRRGRSGGSKEDLPLPKFEPAPEVRVIEAPKVSEAARVSVPKHNNPITEPPLDPSRSKSAPAHAPVQPSAGLGRSHSKREKSRNRLLKDSGKSRGKDPDRECIVM